MMKSVTCLTQTLSIDRKTYYWSCFQILWSKTSPIGWGTGVLFLLVKYIMSDGKLLYFDSFVHVALVDETGGEKRLDTCLVLNKLYES